MSYNAYMLEGGLTLIIIAYCGPLLIGGIILIFMIKPLFAKAAKKQEPYRLDPSDEPLLFEFVYRICKGEHDNFCQRIVIYKGYPFFIYGESQNLSAYDQKRECDCKDSVKHFLASHQGIACNCY